MKRLVTLSTVILAFILLLLPNTGCGPTTPAGKKSLFVGSYEDATGYSIFVMDADGSNHLELAPWCWFPGTRYWSPDGTRLAYTDTLEVSGEDWLCLIDADGTNQCKLAELAEVLPAAMSWAPDGKTIILGCFVGGETKEIDNITHELYYQDLYTVDVETGELKKLTDTPDIQEARPSWSPDGGKISFIASNRDPSTWEAISSDIYLIDADGGNQTRITSHPAGMFIRFFSWSPNGKKIVYSLYNQEEGKNSSDIYLVDVKRGSSINLTNSPTIGDFDPSWSPDGKRIAFCSGVIRGDYHLCLMDADGSNITKLTDISDYPAVFPSWSPDGKRITFTDRDDIYAIDADGSNITKLTRDTGIYRDFLYPIWLPQ